jgi:hypothetical protein
VTTGFGFSQAVREQASITAKPLARILDLNTLVDYRCI